MKILFVMTRKNSDPKDRELYEMDFMCQVLGFQRSLLDLGIVTVAACTPSDGASTPSAGAVPTPVVGGGRVAELHSAINGRAPYSQE